MNDYRSIFPEYLSCDLLTSGDGSSENTTNVYIKWRGAGINNGNFRVVVFKINIIGISPCVVVIPTIEISIRSG